MLNIEQEVNNVVEFIRDYYNKNNLKGAVLGISGGKDSAVVVGLMCKALGPENVIGVTLPCHSRSVDASDAQLVADAFGFKLYNIDLTPVYDTFTAEINKLGLAEPESAETKNSDINLKPRLRMSAVYYMAALLSAVKGGAYLVAGTSNACELHVGYFTKGGDNVHDIAPIAGFTVEEVIAIGEAIGVPDKVIHRAPDDGLSGMTDEEKMGVTYADIALDMFGLLEEGEAKEKIDRMHRGSRHKFSVPSYKPDRSK